jgi:hypothetical protein
MEPSQPNRITAKPSERTHEAGRRDLEQSRVHQLEDPKEVDAARQQRQRACFAHELTARQGSCIFRGHAGGELLLVLVLQTRARKAPDRCKQHLKRTN